MEQFRESLSQDFYDGGDYHVDAFTRNPTPSFAKSVPKSGVGSAKKFRLVAGSGASVHLRIEKEFERLAERLRTELAFSSSTHDRYFHPAYQRIIGMGGSALQLLLNDLKENDSDWFWALECITGSNPVRKSDWGDFQKQKAAWLRWAEKNVNE